ncbi:MAG TPA: hypothetical protein VFD91_03790 [Mariniphaga sp.]|nr:hypothetical protein [Mariniphaga sp.]
MFILDGGSYCLLPSQFSITFNEQLADCLDQLKNNSQSQIYKVNFFVDVNSAGNYQSIKQLLEKEVLNYFSSPVLCNVIAQCPANGNILAEVHYFDDKIWNQKLIVADQGTALLFQKEDVSVVVGQVQSSDFGSCHKNSHCAFTVMKGLLKLVGFEMNNVMRQWNYIENILGCDNRMQRYQQFNNIRSVFYNNSFKDHGYPAATGIGTYFGGVQIEFLAIKSPDIISLPVDNPLQVAAHCYSHASLDQSCEVKLTPKFERARYLELKHKKQLLISGTASIKGEKTVSQGDVIEQTINTIANIQALFKDEILKECQAFRSFNSGGARVYLKNRKFYPEVKQVVDLEFKNLPIIYLVTDICRKDLLVEIEGYMNIE